MVHFGLKRSILVHLGPPTVRWPFLNKKNGSTPSTGSVEQSVSHLLDLFLLSLDSRANVRL